jgi:hypothetical protein
VDEKALRKRKYQLERLRYWYVILRFGNERSETRVGRVGWDGGRRDGQRVGVQVSGGNGGF